MRELLLCDRSDSEGTAAVLKVILGMASGSISGFSLAVAISCPESRGVKGRTSPFELADCPDESISSISETKLSRPELLDCLLIRACAASWRKCCGAAG